MRACCRCSRHACVGLVQLTWMQLACMRGASAAGVRVGAEAARAGHLEKSAGARRGERARDCCCRYYGHETAVADGTLLVRGCSEGERA
jgi:hypothetical protein